MIPINNLRSFPEATEAVLNFLSQYFSFQSWMITRLSGNNLVVLQVADNNYQIQPGDVFNWQDTFCYQTGGAIASKTVPSFSDPLLYKYTSFNIQSYIGQPILQKDGALFGTLCAINPNQEFENILEEMSLIKLLANLLSSILQLELKEQEEARNAEHFMTKALTDPLTDIFNRRAWDHFISSEEIRCKKYGNPTSVLIIDINYLKQINDQLGHSCGDDLLKKTASTLKACVRPNDVVARLGGDEFGILLIETNENDSIAFLKRIKKALRKNKIDAAVGLALRHPLKGLLSAINEADFRMYLNKQKHKKINISYS